MTTEYRFKFDRPAHVHQPLVQMVVDELRGCASVPCPSTGANAIRCAEVMDSALESFYGGRSDDFWEREDTWPGPREKRRRTGTTLSELS